MNHISTHSVEKMVFVIAATVPKDTHTQQKKQKKQAKIKKVPCTTGSELAIVTLTI